MRAAILLPLAALLTLGAAPEDLQRARCDGPARTATSYCTLAFFYPDTAEVPDSALPILDKVVAEVADNEATQVVLASYASDGRDAKAAMTFSRRMAESVRGYLIQNGVDERLITIEAYGANGPRGKTAVDNRRVEIWVMWK